jgi:hypothetical protein
LTDLLGQLLKLEYSLLVNCPRLARMIPDMQTRNLAVELGSTRVGHTDFIVKATHLFGGMPIWNFEPVPDDSDLLELFTKLREREIMLSGLYQRCVDLIEMEDLKSQFAALAEEEKDHSRTVEIIIGRLEQTQSQERPSPV